MSKHINNNIFITSFSAQSYKQVLQMNHNDSPHDVLYFHKDYRKEYRNKHL